MSMPLLHTTLATALRKLLADPSKRAQAEKALRVYNASDMAQKASARRRKASEPHGHGERPIMIEDQRFASIHRAFKCAQAAGYDGSEATFAQRTRKPGLTWADAIKPVDPARQARRRKIAEEKREQLQRELRGEK
ncbi:MAG: hypothetical protein KBG29_07910 [Pseudomonadales bacterium]|nr:hypothetical protein [Pseudomonadales bacterium]